jgi:hypothetical protein
MEVILVLLFLAIILSLKALVLKTRRIKADITSDILEVINGGLYIPPDVQKNLFDHIRKRRGFASKIPLTTIQAQLDMMAERQQIKRVKLDIPLQVGSCTYSYGYRSMPSKHGSPMLDLKEFLQMLSQEGIDIVLVQGAPYFTIDIPGTEKITIPFYTEETDERKLLILLGGSALAMKKILMYAMSGIHSSSILARNQLEEILQLMQKQET